MIQQIYKLIFNRNIVLIGAIVLGIVAGGLSDILKDSSIYILAIVMTFATTGIETKGLLPISKSIKTMGVSILLGYFIFSTVLLTLSWLLIDNTYLFYGMVIIAASPPGGALIPFTQILKGDMNYSMVGTLGAFIASIFVAPLIIMFFAGADTLNPIDLLVIMGKIIVVPFFISRFLLFKKVYPVVEKIRGRLVEFGFAIIIYIAVGLNRDVLFANFDILASISTVLVISIFGLGGLHRIVSKRLNINKQVIISQNLLLTVKSAGFSASTSLIIFGKEAALPAAIYSIIGLFYLLYLSISNELKR